MFGGKNIVILVLIALLVALVAGYLYQQHMQEENTETLEIDTPFRVTEDGKTKDVDFKITIEKN